jgi:hypothetical protein
MVMIQRLARVGHIIMQYEKPIARKGKLRGEDKWMEEKLEKMVYIRYWDFNNDKRLQIIPIKPLKYQGICKLPKPIFCL